METFYARFTGTNESDKGYIYVSPTSDADTQTWTLTALSGTTFSVVGSRSGNVGTLTVDIDFTCDDGVITIASGTMPYDVGDSYVYSLHGYVMPRYVKKDSSANVINYPGGPAADTNQEGTWLVSRRAFENMPRIMDKELSFGDLLDHFRSIIKSQDAFEGSSFGINNYHELDHNLGYGGSIRDYSSNFQLLASNLLQKDLSPLTIISFAELEYARAIASVDQFIINELAQFAADTNVSLADVISTINLTLPANVALLARFEELRGENQLLRDVYSDSTAPVTNWPITLPAMGLATAVEPVIAFDNILGINTIVHHDGHVSPVATESIDLNRALAQTIVTRSDGAMTAGSVSVSFPTNPYARQLWNNPSLSTQSLKVFDVVSDLATPPTTGEIGDYWYKRSTQTLYEWNNTTMIWDVSATPINNMWRVIDVALIRDSLIFGIETKLYDAIHPSIVQKYDLTDFAAEADSEIELAAFSARHNYDMYAPDYIAGNAFTWNYSQASIAGVDAGTARWYDIYEDYFDQPGVSLPTCRPNIEPWKLLNYTTKAAANTGLGINWDTNWGSVAAMWTYIKAQRPGMKVCVNDTTGALLPPYVNIGDAQSVNALLTVIPTGVADSYGFGDNGPVEMVWKKSLEFLYGMARVAFKLEPMQFLDKTWGYTYVTSADNQIRLERNLAAPLPPSKFKLHGEQHNVISTRTASLYFVGGGALIGADDTAEFICTHVEDNATYFYVYVNDTLIGSITVGSPFTFTSGTVVYSGVTLSDRGIPFNLGDAFTVTTTSIVFAANLTQKFLGFGQTFTNLLRHNYIASDISEAVNAYRGWEMRLAHRVEALIRGDSLRIGAASIEALPPTAYDLVLKRSTAAESKWISALRVQLVQQGTKVPDKYGNEIPYADGSDWQFRIEVYNPRHPTAAHYDFNLSGDYQTFSVLDKSATALSFKHYTQKTALSTVTMPIVITGVQNVVNFLFGYTDRLTEQGWTLNTGDRIITDDLTGRNLNWQLEIEKFIDAVYRGMLTGEGHVLNPFMHGLWLDTPIGLMSRYSDKTFLDVDSVQAAYDVTGAAIPVRDLQVIRTDENAVTYSDTPIFSAHAFVDEFEHVILFNEKVSDETDSRTLFNPFLGLRITTADVAYVRQEELDRKPRFQGYVLAGNDVKRNIVSSVDAIAGYYDAHKTFNEPTTAEHALALLGWSKKDYFTNLGTSDATQFNFWRGLIQAKGTNMTVDAFVNYKKFTGAEVDEYWAYKLAEYGDARRREYPEIKIEVADTLQNFTQLQFYDEDDESYDPLPLFTQIENDDDARWFTLDDLGHGVNFPGDPVSVTLASTAVGYYQLSTIFHNGDGGAPVVWLRATNTSTGVVTETVATTAEMISSSLAKVTGVLTAVPNTTFEYVVKGFTWHNPSKLSPVKLFNYQDKTLIKEVGLWHPAIGIHAYEALDVVNSIVAQDPALYNTTIQTVNNTNYATVKPWGKREVGRVWWDTANLAFIPYYDATVFPDRNERNARWGNLADWASIDLYEWVESDVAPEEYDDLAAEEEGQSDIPSATRKSGKAAQKKFYSRDRVISARPIAWSYTPSGSAAAHPSFGTPVAQKAYIASSVIYVDATRVEETGLSADSHFSAWSRVANKPIGEAIVGTELAYDLGSTTELGAPFIIESGLIGVMNVTAIPSGRLGNYIGPITLSSRLEQIDTSIYLQKLRAADSFGNYEDVTIEDWLAESEDDRTYEFVDFGIQIKITRTNSVITYAAIDIVSDMVASWSDVYVREGVRFTEILSLPDTVFVNDINDPDSSNYDYGWRAWVVPTQAQLDVDLIYPRNAWMPYLGDQVTTNPTPDVISEMKNGGLVLKSGVSVNRFSSTWTEWVEIVDRRLQKLSNGAASISFNRTEFLGSDEELDVNRISLYANGLQMSPKTYTIVGDVGAETVQILGVQQEGTTVLFIYRAKQITDAELAFDSSVEDDPSVQTEYKASYQYTKVDVRSETGAIIGAKYYFWVQDSTVVRPGKSISLSQAKTTLKNGPSQFMLFARLVDGFYDSCVIAGLNRYVTNNSTFKLRFTQDETLRDDPEQIKLKNVHTEWVLLKKSQNSKIPSKLWEQLTDAAAGADAGGNPLPSPSRVDYDERHGTRTSYGFDPGQILAATDLVRETIKNTILNTSLEIRISNTTVPDNIVSLDFDDADDWFKDAVAARATMNLIWSTARAKQINEIFFAVLEDALANNYEFSDIFKTSMISIRSSSNVENQDQVELQDGPF